MNTWKNSFQYKMNDIQGLNMVQLIIILRLFLIRKERYIWQIEGKIETERF